MVYEFRYVYRGSTGWACERAFCLQDAAARAKAAEVLLRMPSRLAVEVWCGARLVYVRRRGQT